MQRFYRSIPVTRQKDIRIHLDIQKNQALLAGHFEFKQRLTQIQG